MFNWFLLRKQQQNIENLLIIQVESKQLNFHNTIKNILQAAFKLFIKVKSQQKICLKQLLSLNVVFPSPICSPHQPSFLSSRERRLSLKCKQVKINFNNLWFSKVKQNFYTSPDYDEWMIKQDNNFPLFFKEIQEEASSQQLFNLINSPQHLKHTELNKVSLKAHIFQKFHINQQGEDNSLKLLYSFQDNKEYPLNKQNNQKYKNIESASSSSSSSSFLKNKLLFTTTNSSQLQTPKQNNRSNMSQKNKFIESSQQNKRLNTKKTKSQIYINNDCRNFSFYHNKTLSSSPSFKNTQTNQYPSSLQFSNNKYLNIQSCPKMKKGASSSLMSTKLHNSLSHISLDNSPNMKVNYPLLPIKAMNLQNIQQKSISQKKPIEKLFKLNKQSFSTQNSTLMIESSTTQGDMLQLQLEKNLEQDSGKKLLISNQNNINNIPLNSSSSSLILIHSCSPRSINLDQGEDSGRSKFYSKQIPSFYPLISQHQMNEEEQQKSVTNNLQEKFNISQENEKFETNKTNSEELILNSNLRQERESPFLLKKSETYSGEEFRHREISEEGNVIRIKASTEIKEEKKEVKWNLSKRQSIFQINSCQNVLDLSQNINHYNRKSRSSMTINQQVLQHLRRQSSLGKRRLWEKKKNGLSLKELEKESDSSESNQSSIFNQDQDDSEEINLKKQLYGCEVDIENEDPQIEGIQKYCDFTKGQKKIRQQVSLTFQLEQKEHGNGNGTENIRKNRIFSFDEKNDQSFNKNSMRLFYSQKETIERKFQQFLTQNFSKKQKFEKNFEQNQNCSNERLQEVNKELKVSNNLTSPKKSANSQLQQERVEENLSKVTFNPQILTKYTVYVNPPINSSPNLQSDQLHQSNKISPQQEKQTFSFVSYQADEKICDSKSQSNNTLNSESRDSLSSMNEYLDEEDSDLEELFISAKSSNVQKSSNSDLSNLELRKLYSFKRTSTNKIEDSKKISFLESLQCLNQEFHKSYIFVRNYLVNYFSRSLSENGQDKITDRISLANKIKFFIVNIRERNHFRREGELEGQTQQKLKEQRDLKNQFVQEQNVIQNYQLPSIIEHTFCPQSCKINYFFYLYKPLRKASIILHSSIDQIDENPEYFCKESLLNIVQKVEVSEHHLSQLNLQNSSSSSSSYSSSSSSQSQLPCSTIQILGNQLGSSNFIQDTDNYEDENFNFFSLINDYKMKVVCMNNLGERESLFQQINESIPPVRSSLHEKFIDSILERKRNGSFINKITNNSIIQKFQRIDYLMREDSSKNQSFIFSNYQREQRETLESKWEDSIYFKSEIIKQYKEAIRLKKIQTQKMKEKFEQKEQLILKIPANKKHSKQQRRGSNQLSDISNDADNVLRFDSMKNSFTETEIYYQPDNQYIKIKNQPYKFPQNETNFECGVSNQTLKKKTQKQNIPINQNILNEGQVEELKRGRRTSFQRQTTDSTIYQEQLIFSQIPSKVVSKSKNKQSIPVKNKCHFSSLNSSQKQCNSHNKTDEGMSIKSFSIRSQLIQQQKKNMMNSEQQLFHAIKSNHINEIIDLLQNYYSLQIKARDEEGNSFLMVATKVGNLQIVKELMLKEPSLLNFQNDNGDTALHLALSYGNTKIADYLLSCKIDQNITNNQNKIAWDIAIPK